MLSLASVLVVLLINGLLLWQRRDAPCQLIQVLLKPACEQKIQHCALFLFQSPLFNRFLFAYLNICSNPIPSGFV